MSETTTESKVWKILWFRVSNERYKALTKRLMVALLFFWPIGTGLTFYGLFRLMRLLFPGQKILQWILTFSPIVLYSVTYFTHPEYGWTRELMFARRFWKGFGWNVVHEVSLDSSKQYMYAAAPHGVIPVGLNSVLNEPTYPLALGARFQFWVPIVRDFMMAFGLVDANRETFRKALAAGRSVAIVPGGVREMIMSQPSNTVVKINSKNLGFCAEAIRYGVPLVPVFSFGEHNFYDQKLLPLSVEWQARIKKGWGGVHPFIPVGEHGFLLPKNVPHTVVFGSPIPVTKNENPTPEQINALRIEFYNQLMRLFYRWRARVGYPELELHCIERNGSRMPLPPDIVPSSPLLPSSSGSTSSSSSTPTSTTSDAPKRANL